MTTKSPKQHDEALAAWAEDEMKLPANSPTALRGAAAAEHGQKALARAMGRPSIDPAAKTGHHARRRQVRFPEALDAAADELVAAGQAPNFSVLMRKAFGEYLERHRATQT